MHVNTSLHLQEIDAAIEESIRNKDRAQLDVAAVLENLRQAETPLTSTTYWTTGISIFLLLLLLFCCYY
jgi:hypothetical protein